MRTEIINIGTELLSGQVINTNAAFLGRAMGSIGLTVSYQTVTADDRDQVVSSIQAGLKRSEVVIVTGGLGPTVDDITIAAIAKALNKKLLLDHNILKQIKARFKKRKINMPASNIRQAYIPEKAKIIKNPIGTAPGIIINIKPKKYLIALPGVPGEMEAMIQQLLPFFKRISPGKSIIKSRSIKISSLSESAVNDKINDLFPLEKGLSLGIYASPSQIEIKITAKTTDLLKANNLISKLEKAIKTRLKTNIFGTDKETMESAVARLLLKQKKTLSIAESCTGGLITHRLTNIPNSSKYLLMGLVAYSNKTKTQILKVSSQVIKKHGAVSQQTALGMAKGIKKMANSQIALSVTGIAGPGRSKKKPVGLVHMVLIAEKKEYHYEYNFSGTREMIKYRASQAGLELIRRHLLNLL